jgi:hypothetical protein
MDAIKYINPNRGDREGNAITHVTPIGSSQILDKHSNTCMVAMSGILNTRFDEVRYYTNDA